MRMTGEEDVKNCSKRINDILSALLSTTVLLLKWKFVSDQIFLCFNNCHNPTYQDSILSLLPNDNSLDFRQKRVVTFRKTY